MCVCVYIYAICNVRNYGKTKTDVAQICRNGGHVFLFPLPREHTPRAAVTRSIVAVPRGGFFYAFVFLCAYLSPFVYTCTRTCAHTSSTCTHYRLRGRYGFYERRCAASEGGRSDAFDTIYKRLERGHEEEEEEGKGEGEEGGERIDRGMEKRDARVSDEGSRGGHTK